MNYTDPDEPTVPDDYITMTRLTSVDESGYTTFEVVINPDDAETHRLAMNNNHTLAIEKRYWMINDEYKTVSTDTFMFNFTCNTTAEDFPYAFSDTCFNYEWCLRNYRVDFFGRACP